MWCLALEAWLLEFSVSLGAARSGQLPSLEVHESAQFYAEHGCLLVSLLLYGPFYGL